MLFFWLTNMERICLFVAACVRRASAQCSLYGGTCWFSYRSIQRVSFFVDSIACSCEWNDLRILNNMFYVDSLHLMIDKKQQPHEITLDKNKKSISRVHRVYYM